MQRLYKLSRNFVAPLQDKLHETLGSVTPSDMNVSQRFRFVLETDRFDFRLWAYPPEQLLLRSSPGDVGFSLLWIAKGRCCGFKFEPLTTATALESLISAGVSTAR